MARAVEFAHVPRRRTGRSGIGRGRGGPVRRRGSRLDPRPPCRRRTARTCGGGRRTHSSRARHRRMGPDGRMNSNSAPPPPPPTSWPRSAPVCGCRICARPPSTSLATARAQRWDPAEVVRVLLQEEVVGRDAATFADAPQEREILNRQDVLVVAPGGVLDSRGHPERAHHARMGASPGESGRVRSSRYRRFELRSLSFALVMTFLRLMQCGWWRSLGG